MFITFPADWTWHEIEPYQHTLPIGKVTHETPQRRWNRLDEGRRRDNLLAFSESRLLVDVNHLELIAPLEVPFTNPLQIGDRSTGLGSTSHDIEPEDISLLRASSDGAIEFFSGVDDASAFIGHEVPTIHAPLQATRLSGAGRAPPAHVPCWTDRR